MKILFFLLAFAPAWALACPDYSGTYYEEDEPKEITIYEVTDCENIRVIHKHEGDDKNIIITDYKVDGLLRPAKIGDGNKALRSVEHSAQGLSQKVFLLEPHGNIVAFQRWDKFVDENTIESRWLLFHDDSSVLEGRGRLIRK